MAFSPARGEDDPYRWLEELDSARAADWVDVQSARARRHVEALPGYDERYRRTLRALSSTDNIQFVESRDGYLYNFYRNAKQPHGIWRRTTLEEYRLLRPSWQVLLDLDALANRESRNWVWGGAWVAPGKTERALVSLSIGGEDRIDVREFDMSARRFVEGGFVSPRAKQQVRWLNPDELLIATDFGSGSLSDSGYSIDLRRWRRGQALAQAQTVLRGVPNDMWVQSYARNGIGSESAAHSLALLSRRIDFFRYEHRLLQGTSVTPLGMPQDSEVWLHNDWLLVRLRSEWDVGTQRFSAGALLAAPISGLAQQSPGFEVLFEPGERRSLVWWVGVRDGIAVVESTNLRPRLYWMRHNGRTFERRDLPGIPASNGELPDSLAIRAGQAGTNQLWVTTNGLISPQAFGLLDLDNGKFETIKEQGAFFDSSGLQVLRFEARSADGTLVPYTVVTSKGVALDGKLPTMMFGYGGFGLSLYTGYMRLQGINWLQYGGAYVQAHIRGGGEFGEAWHKAAKGVNRQKAFDDFIAVAQDLVARKITSPARLGIYGASNGGILVTAVMTQRPELFGAVVARVPLTDMLRYTELLAGPSWVEEKGDPRVPAEREVLAKWSPYHQVKAERKYPPILLIGNRNDDRVHPAHARKMAAKMLEQGHRVWFFEELQGGHSGTSNPQIYATREALLYTFMMGTLSPER